jgi:hypothetical protein
MGYVRSSRSTQPCSLHTQSRAPLTPSRLFSYYVKTHPRQSSSQQSRRRLHCLYSFIEVSSFILFFSSEFSSFTVCISSSISVSLVLNSSTNFCRFCSISNVVLLVLIAAAAASVDAVGTPMVVRDIMDWNGMEVITNEPVHFQFYYKYNI